MTESFLFLLIGSYTLFTLLLYVTWNRIRPPATGQSSLQAAGTPLISVIIPVRNESDHIADLLDDLARQTLPPEQFEVLVVDDASTDDTAGRVLAFTGTSGLDLTLLPLPETETASPKKRAITSAIAICRGGIVVTTDGDCRVPPGWLRAHLDAYAPPGIQLVAGPVTFTREERLTDYLQTVEFSSLIGSGACAIAAGKPAMCNGANLSYRKTAFEAVGGFGDTVRIASGDDELLMHRISAAFPRSVAFLKDRSALVHTRPHHSWRSFFDQRKRWASKWKFYRSAAPRLLAVYIFTVNAVLLSALPLTLTGHLSGYTLAALTLLKILPEWLFISTVLRFLGKPHCIPVIPLVQLFYPVYVTLFGVAGQAKTYQWKGRGQAEKSH